MAIQTDFARRTFDGYFHELSRIGSIYADLFKNSYGPAEHALQNSPDIRVTAKAAQALTMAVHELATDAAKYGALASKSADPTQQKYAEAELAAMMAGLVKLQEFRRRLT